MVRLGLLVLLPALAGCGLWSSNGCSTSAPVPLAEIPLPPAHGKTLSVDAMDVDQQGHLVFTADRTLGGVDVLDVSARTPEFLTTVLVGPPNGVAVAPDLHLVAAALNGGTLAIISTDRSAASPFAVLRRIATGGKTGDLVGYDAREHRFFMADPDGGSLYDVDPTGAQPPRAIALGAGMEQPAWDPTSGHVLVAGGSYDGLYEIDPATDKLLARHDLGSGCQPNGLAINPNGHIALLGCSAKGYQQVLIWDLRHGKLMRADREVGGGDLASYDPVANRFFFAASHFSSGPEVAVFDGSSGAYQTAVVLPAAANSAVFDETNGVVYTTDARPGAGGLFHFTVPAC
jgi:DNA-binding beta-propeller fold protein YncE